MTCVHVTSNLLLKYDFECLQLQNIGGKVCSDDLQLLISKLFDLLAYLTCKFQLTSEYFAFYF